MPKPPLPPRVEALVRKPNPAVVASIRPDGTPHTAASWYDWEDGRVLLSSGRHASGGWGTSGATRACR